MNRRTLQRGPLRLETLDKRCLMAADVVESEPNNTESTADRFDLPAAESVVLKGSASADDRDYFAFIAPASGPVSIQAGSNAQLRVEVTDRAGNNLFESEPKDHSTGGTWQAVEGTTYLVRMRSTEKTPLDYAVQLAAGSDVPPPLGGGENGGNGSNNNSTGQEIEPNDKRGSATQVNLSTDAAVHLTGSASKQDRDFFVVQPSAAGDVTVTASTGAVKISIESTSGVKLFESESNNNALSGSFTIVDSSPMVVRVRGVNGTATPYDFALQLGPASGTPNVPLSNSKTPEGWYDSNDDGSVTPIDALLVINHINSHNSHSSVDEVFAEFDVNDDGTISAIDPLLIINRLNVGHGTDDTQPDDSRNRPTGEGEDHIAKQFSDTTDLPNTEQTHRRRRGK